MVASALRVVFLGTPEFAVPTLDALIQSRHAVVGVVTQPDKPRGRGRHVSDAPVKARAAAAGLSILQPERLKDPRFVSDFSAWHADLGVVAAYGKILPEALIETPRLGMINVHASLLPRYRGAAPVHRAIMAGETATGVTIMRVVKALDAGPMMASIGRSIGPAETSEDVERDLARLGSDLLVKVVDDLSEGRNESAPQDETAATYANRLTREDGRILWDRSALSIHDQIRGLHPWPHAFAYVDGTRYIILRSEVGNRPPSSLAPGTIAEAVGDRLTVATGDRLIRLLQIQPEGKRPLSAREFLAGHHFRPSAAFSSIP
jgi:methionyl-tRNA formyltransferase